MSKMPKLELLQYLTPGDVLHHTKNTNADGTPQRWRVNGKPKVAELCCPVGAKVMPCRYRIPVKHGLKNTDQLYLPDDVGLINWIGLSKVLRWR